MRIVLMILMLCGIASGDTYRFDHAKGHLEKHDRRCASPKAIKRMHDLMDRDPKITIGHGQMTYTYVQEGSIMSSSADHVIENIGRWIYPPDGDGAQLTVIIDVAPFGWCAHSIREALDHVCDPVPEVKVSIIQRYDGAECYESWHGDGVKL